MNQKERWKIYSLEHREELNAKARARYQLNKEKEAIRGKIYRDAKREWLRERSRLVYEAKPERKSYKKQLEHSTKLKATRRAWKLKNKEWHVAYHVAYEKKYRNRRKQLHDDKQANNPQYRLRRTLRASLKNAIKHSWRGGSAIDNLGCTIEELRLHLEKQWQPGMTWSNFGRVTKSNDTWQIDHIEPLSSFDLTDPEQVALACHYTNLAPLWALDNRRKGNKIQKQKGGAKCPHDGPHYVGSGA